MVNEVDRKFLSLMKQGISKPEQLDSVLDTIRHLFPQQWLGVLSDINSFVSYLEKEDYLRTLSKKEKITFLKQEIANLERQGTLENVLTSEEHLRSTEYLRNLFCVNKAEVYDTLIYGANKQVVDSLIEERLLEVVAERTYRLRLSPRGKKELGRLQRSKSSPRKFPNWQKRNKLQVAKTIQN